MNTTRISGRASSVTVYKWFRQLALYLILNCYLLYQKRKVQLLLLVTYVQGYIINWRAYSYLQDIQLVTLPMMSTNFVAATVSMIIIVSLQLASCQNAACTNANTALASNSECLMAFGVVADGGMTSDNTAAILCGTSCRNLVNAVLDNCPNTVHYNTCIYSYS